MDGIVIDIKIHILEQVNEVLAKYGIGSICGDDLRQAWDDFRGKNEDPQHVRRKLDEVLALIRMAE